MKRKITDKMRLEFLNGIEGFSWSMCTPDCIKRFGHNKYDGEYKFNGAKQYDPEPSGIYDYYVGPLNKAVDACLRAKGEGR